MIKNFRQMTALRLVGGFANEKHVKQNPLRMILDAHAFYEMKSILMSSDFNGTSLSIEMKFKGDYRIHNVESVFDSIEEAKNIAESYIQRQIEVTNDPESKFAFIKEQLSTLNSDSHEPIFARLN